MAPPTKLLQGRAERFPQRLGDTQETRSDSEVSEDSWDNYQILGGYLDNRAMRSLIPPDGSP